MNNKQAAANVRFFQEGLLEAGFAEHQLVLSHPLLFELPLWLQLGMRIGFFDEEHSGPLLKDRRMSGGPELDFILQISGASDVKRRLLSGETDFADEPEVHATFRNYLLMATDLIHNREAWDFLSKLHNADAWMSMIDPGEMWVGSLQGVCGGFAYVLAYLQDTLDITYGSTKESQIELGQMLRDLQRLKLGLDIDKLLSDRDLSVRYFELAGLIMSGIDDAEGLDPTRTAFSKLAILMETWLGPSIVRRTNEQIWWSAYSTRIRAVRSSGMIRQRQFRL